MLLAIYLANLDIPKVAPIISFDCSLGKISNKAPLASTFEKKFGFLFFLIRLLCKGSRFRFGISLNLVKDEHSSRDIKLINPVDKQTENTALESQFIKLN